jgi:transcriptional regulator with XRE-family HTH domain
MARRLEEPDKALGLAIQQLRNERDLKSREVAKRADVNPTHYSRLENARVNPSWAMVRRVAEALDLPVSELAARAERIARERQALRPQSR